MHKRLSFSAAFNALVWRLNARSRKRAAARRIQALMEL
jgi:hypothetical protein